MNATVGQLIRGTGPAPKVDFSRKTWVYVSSPQQPTTSSVCGLSFSLTIQPAAPISVVRFVVSYQRHVYQRWPHTLNILGLHPTQTLAWGFLICIRTHFQLP